MAVQLISYDLRKPGRKYDELYKAIKAYGTWCHPVESVWLVWTDQGPGAVLGNLRRHLDVNDRIAVFELEGEWSSLRISTQASDWLYSVLKDYPRP